MNKVITIDSGKKIFVSIYHIGYSSQGESIIFILYTKEKEVLYSMVVDCYQEDQCNLTADILQEWNLEGKVNIFIWTHPHDDHSVGVINIIDKYCTKETKIFLANILSSPTIFSGVCRENVEYLSRKNFRKQNKSKWKINPMVHFPEKMDEIDFNGKSEIQRLTVRCIAPIPHIMSSVWSNERLDCNKIGIACTVVIKLKDGNINFLLGGDMEKQTIEALIEEEDENIPRMYNYIKIPHHGSQNAEGLIEYLRQNDNQKSEFASVSVFKSQGLPKKNVLKKYFDVVQEIACTSDVLSENKYGIGVIKLEYSINDRLVRKVLHGTANIIDFENIADL